MSQELGSFPQTPWTLVGHSAQATDDARRRSLGQLLTRYLPALRAHLLYRKRTRPGEADDLLQSFIADRVVAQDLIAHANRERGKFRTFLLTALDRYAISRHRSDTAAKRSPGQIGQIDTSDPAARDAAATTFESEWARQLLDQAIEAMRTDCNRSNRSDVWTIFEARILCVAQDREPASYDELRERFANLTPTQMSNLLITAKRMFARHLRGAIAEYADAGQIDDELNDLRNILSKTVE